MQGAAFFRSHPLVAVRRFGFRQLIPTSFPMASELEPVPLVSSRSYVLPTVNVQFGSIHVARRFGAKKIDSLCHLLWEAKASKGNLVLYDLVCPGRQDRRIDFAGRDRI